MLGLYYVSHHSFSRGRLTDSVQIFRDLFNRGTGLDI